MFRNAVRIMPECCPHVFGILSICHRNRCPHAAGIRTKAEKLLKQALAHGAVLAVKIEQLADENGISFKTFKRAREIIGAIAFRRDGKWYWDLPIEIVYEDAGQADSGQGCPSTALAVIGG